MPKYVNQCGHVKKSGEQCSVKCRSNYCGPHMYHPKPKISVKKCEYTTCKHLGCETATRSMFGYCSIHSQHQRYEAMRDKNPNVGKIVYVDCKHDECKNKTRAVTGYCKDHRKL